MRIKDIITEHRVNEATPGTGIIDKWALALGSKLPSFLGGDTNKIAHAITVEARELKRLWNAWYDTLDDESKSELTIEDIHNFFAGEGYDRSARDAIEKTVQQADTPTVDTGVDTQDSTQPQPVTDDIMYENVDNVAQSIANNIDKFILKMLDNAHKLDPKRFASKVARTAKKGSARARPSGVEQRSGYMSGGLLGGGTDTGRARDRSRDTGASDAVKELDIIINKLNQGQTVDKSDLDLLTRLRQKLASR